MEPFLNLAPEVYEAIIAASLAVGVIAVLALARQSRRARHFKQASIKIATVATKTLLSVAAASTAEIERHKRRADEAERRMREAERLAMELAADADDQAEDSASHHADPLALLFGGRDPYAAFADQAIRDLVFGGAGVQAARKAAGAPYGTPGASLTKDDIVTLLKGDVAGLKDRMGMPKGVNIDSIEVYGQDGHRLTEAERSALLAELTSGDEAATAAFAGSAFVEPKAALDVDAGLPEATKAALAGKDARYEDRRVPRFTDLDFPNNTSPRAG